MYGRNAEEVKSALLAAHSGLTVVLNPEKPRRNSFEITLLDGGKGMEVQKRKFWNNSANWNPQRDPNILSQVSLPQFLDFYPFIRAVID